MPPPHPYRFSGLVIRMLLFGRRDLIDVRYSLCMKKNRQHQLERNIASDIWGFRDIIQLLLNFIKL